MYNPTDIRCIANRTNMRCNVETKELVIKYKFLPVDAHTLAVVWGVGGEAGLDVLTLRLLMSYIYIYIYIYILYIWSS